MKLQILIFMMVSSHSFALTVKPGHYLGTLEIGGKPTGAQCHVHVESETPNNSGEGCFDYLVSSKELGVSQIKLAMRRDILTGNNLAKCSLRVLPSLEADKIRAYITDYNESLNMLVNVKSGFFRERVSHCKDLTYIKDN